MRKYILIIYKFDNDTDTLEMSGPMFLMYMRINQCHYPKSFSFTKVDNTERMINPLITLGQHWLVVPIYSQYKKKRKLINDIFWG